MRNFWIFRLGQTCSEIGETIGQIALVTYVLGTLQRPDILAQMLTVLMLTRPVFAPLLGKIAGSLDPKKLLIAVDLLRMLLGLLLVVAVRAGTAHGVLLVAVYVASQQLGMGFQIASQAWLPKLVGAPDRVMSGLKSQHVLKNVATIVGALAAIALIDRVSIQAALLVDAVSFLLGAGMTALVVQTAAAEQGAASTPAAGVTALAKGATATLRWPLFVSLIAINSVLALVGFLVPVSANEMSPGKAWGIGSAELCLSVGGVLAPFLLSAIKREFFQKIGVLLGAGMLSVSLLTMMLSAAHAPALLGSVLFLSIGVSWIHLLSMDRILTVLNNQKGSTAYLSKLELVIGISGPLTIQLFALTESHDLAKLALVLLAAAASLAAGYFINREVRWGHTRVSPVS